MSDALIGTELAGHRIEYVIGRGGGGCVYLAEHLALGRKVALKVLSMDLSSDAAYRKRFVREARTAATLTHPAVVTVYDTGDADGLLYISMRYIQGTDLAHVLMKDGPMDVERLLPIASRVADALDAAHGEGLVHRDVKPANILLEGASDPRGTRAYLTDFGIAKPQHTTAGLTRTGDFVGTIDYVAPEQIRDEPVDGRADQYALAASLVECLTGTVPFPRSLGVAVIYAHLGEEPPSVRDRRPDLSVELDAALRRALSKEREDRYETCAALVDALRAANVRAPTTAPVPREETDVGGTARTPPVERASTPSVGVPQALEGDRKQVTVMICEVAARTAGEASGSGSVRTTLEQTLEITRRHGGRIDQRFDGGFLAIFGAPLAYEDHARRAALAAWRSQELAGDAVTLRVALNTGLIAVGRSGEGLGTEYTSIGETVSLAKRIQALARPGTVVLSETTRRAAGDGVRTLLIDPTELGEHIGGTQVYRLEGVTAGHRTSDDGTGPMVGRAREIATIDRAIRALQDGTGGLVLVAGEAGIGKSRLIAEIGRGRAASEATWLEGRALSFGESTAYWPFLEVIRASAGIAGEDSDHEAWGKLRSRLAELFPSELQEVLPYLATLLGLRVRDGFEERIRYLDDRAMGSHVVFSCRRFFERLAAERPNVLVFEDAHWMDRSSLELLEHLLQLTTSRPVLIVVTARAGSPSVDRLHDAASSVPGMQRHDISLEPLDAAESVRLLESMPGAERLSPREHDAIVAKAGGNPLFLEEVTASLVESGGLRGPTGDQPSTGELRIEIPDSIRDVVLARVDRTGTELREALQVASVIGRVVPTRVFETVVQAPRDVVESQLEALQGLDLLAASPRGAGREHVFKHALVQEAVYQSVAPRRRRELHLLVGRAIESVFRDRLEEFYSLLAHHFAEAKDWERAQEFLFLAGDEAIRVAADAEALAHYERALQSYALAFKATLEPVKRAALERKIGDALFRLGRHDEAIERLLRSLESLGHTYPTSPKAVRRAVGWEFLKHGVYRRTHPGPPRSQDGAAEWGEEVYASYRALSWMHYFMAPMSFGLDVVRSLNVAERTGYQAGIAQGSAGLGLALDVVKQPRLALGNLRRAIEMAEELDHPVAKGEAYLGMAVHDFVQGELDSALSLFTRSCLAYREAGDLRGWGVSRTLESWALRLQGRFDDSLAAGTDALAVAVDAGDTETKAWALEDRARTLCMMGMLDEAIDQNEEALQIFRAIPAPFGIADALTDLGECYLRRFELDRSVECLREARRLIGEAGASGYNATQVLGYLADHHVVVLERSDTSGRADAQRDAARACRAIVRNSRAVPLGVPTAARSRGTFEWLRGRRRPALRWWHRSLEASERIGMPYQVALTEHDFGRLTGERARLERAAAIFADLGAELDATRAREALSVTSS